jgi:hypothetical protein
MNKAVAGEDEDLDTLDVAPDVSEPEDEEQEGEDDAAPDASEEEELVVAFGEEPPPSKEEQAPQWVRDLRKSDREKTRKIRELEQKLAQAEPQKRTAQLGPKPTLESVDYDTDLFEKQLDAWKERKAAHDRQVAEAQEAERKQQESFKAKIDGYNTRKAELKLRDFDEVEEQVKDAFNEMQLGVLLDGAKDAPLLLYALGKDQKRLEELSKVSNPIHFAFAVARMETQLRTSSRKPSAAPETSVRGSAQTTGSDARLDQLYTEAAKTGDLSKVRAYKAKMKK